MIKVFVKIIHLQSLLCVLLVYSLFFFSSFFLLFSFSFFLSTDLFKISSLNLKTTSCNDDRQTDRQGEGEEKTTGMKWTKKRRSIRRVMTGAFKVNESTMASAHIQYFGEKNKRERKKSMHRHSINMKTNWFTCSFIRLLLSCSLARLLVLPSPLATVAVLNFVIFFVALDRCTLLSLSLLFSDHPTTLYPHPTRLERNDRHRLDTFLLIVAPFLLHAYMLDVVIWGWRATTTINVK